MIAKLLIRLFGKPVTENTTIQFECQQCGECCQYRIYDPIKLTGYDLFRLAQFLGYDTPISLVQKGIITIEFSDGFIPFCILATKSNGACVFAKKGRCTVHSAKPSVCASFPLGRLYNSRHNSYHYFVSRRNICPGNGKGIPILAKLWLSQTGVLDDDSLHAEYQHAFSDVAMALRKTSQEYRAALFSFIAKCLFTNFDTREDYLTQLEANMAVLRPMLEAVNTKH